MEFDDRIIDQVADAIVEALVDGAEEIAEESKEQVPKKSGALHDSCKVVRQSEMNIEVNYDMPYAAEVHEDLQSRHSTGKAKYLEDPFNAKVEGIIKSAASKVNRVIE